eukprot:TRINITY_DN5864_c0_g1_i1.p1 TRINITY_DN5864_c0_g1~~TRINITY_DN5864_c0_g1_i1.p1  ORF type:complete len:566 (-),score=84.97 TRINITY_DN5864_c0_g1_i1:143-1687(-)
MAFLLPSIVDEQIMKGILALRLIDTSDQDSFAYGLWINNTLEDDTPEYLNFYIFNITNPKEFLKGAKPKVFEMGPFSYRQYWAKFDVVSEVNPATLSYYKQQWWIPDNEMAKNASTTLVTTAALGFPVIKLNVPEAQAGGWFGDDKWYKDMAGDLLASMGQGELITTVTAKDLIFGVTSPYLQWVKTNVSPEYPDTYTLQFNDTDRFSCVERMNGHTVVFNNKEKVNELIRWNGMEFLYDNTTWGTPDANRIEGTDGRSFNIGVTRDQELTVFLPLGFRHFSFVFQKPVTYLGLALDRFVFKAGQLNSTCSTTNPQCLPYHLYGLKSGLLNVTSGVRSQQGFWSPVFASQPYFLHAHQWYTDNVVFLNGKANEEDHGTYVDVEHITGVSARGRQRTQINYYLRNSALLYPEMMDEVVLPVLWQEMVADASEKDAQSVSSGIYAAQRLQKILTFVGILIGSVACIISIVVFRYAWTHREGVYYTVYKTIASDISSSYVYGSADFTTVSGEFGGER